MARFSDEWLQTLLDKNDIVDVISDVLTLTKRGANYWAPCPWHHERNPSFCVNPAKQMFYCFSCKKGGSAITFVMEYEKLSFPEAVRYLAERVGIELPQEDESEDYAKKKARRKHLSEMMRCAALFYHANLETGEGQRAKEYIKKRGIASQSGPFGLGYAPDSFDALQKHLLSKGYTFRDMIDGGLVKQGERKPYDVMRGRLIFPIQNVFGDVIAFGGRVMGDGEPKYLNTSETFLFNKRKNLYALNIVKKQKKLKSILLLEGYMDVVSLAGAGIRSAVASLGTSLTTDQARLIKRFTNSVYLCYDGDDAGINAALRAVDILATAELSVRVMLLEKGMDPDEYVKKYGPEMFYKAAKNAMTATEFKLSRIRAEFNLNDRNEVVAYCTRAVTMLKGVDNAIERERFVRQVSAETGVSVESLLAQMGQTAAKNRYNLPEKEIELIKKETDDQLKLLSLVIDHPEKLASIRGLEESVFDSDLYKKIFLYVKDQIKRGIIPVGAEIISEFSRDLGDDLGALMSEGADKNDVVSYGEELIERVKYERLARKRDELIKKREGTADAAESAELLSEIGEINGELYEMKRTMRE